MLRRDFLGILGCFPWLSANVVKIFGGQSECLRVPAKLKVGKIVYSACLDVRNARIVVVRERVIRRFDFQPAGGIRWSGWETSNLDDVPGRLPRARITTCFDPVRSLFDSPEDAIDWRENLDLLNRRCDRCSRPAVRMASDRYEATPSESGGQLWEEYVPARETRAGCFVHAREMPAGRCLGKASPEMEAAWQERRRTGKRDRLGGYGWED